MAFLLPFLPSIIGAVGGLAGSISGGKQNAWQQQTAKDLLGTGNQAAASQQSWEQLLQSLGMNPANFMANINQMTPTMNANLTNAVNAGVSSNLAQQGLGESPGQMASEETSKLAPYAQQNQLAAIQSYLSLLGMPGPLNESLMNYGSTASKWLPPPQSGAGGFGSLFSGLANLFGGGGKNQVSPSDLRLGSFADPGIFSSTTPTPGALAGAESSWGIGGLPTFTGMGQ